MQQTLKEKIAYLKGVAEGVNVEIGTKEGRVILGVVDILGSLVEAMERLERRQEELEIFLESLDEELMEMEEYIYWDEDNLIEVQCPQCHDVVYFDSDVLEDEDTIEITCPNCDSVVFVNNGEYDISFEDTPKCGCTPVQEKSNLIQ